MTDQYTYRGFVSFYTRRPRLWLLSLPLLVTFACSPKPQGPFSDATIQEYTSMANLTEEATQGAYVVGKAIVINTGNSLSHHYRTAFTTDDDIEVESQTVSKAHEKIDMQIRAANPGEVGTVVLLKWVQDVVGRNIVGIEFVRVRCEVTVVDGTKRRIVGKRAFAGSAPEGTHRWGSSPEGEIVQWINALPRRAPLPSAQTRADREGPSTPPPVMDRGATREYLDTTNGVSFRYPAAWKEMGPEEARGVMGAATSKYLTVVVYDPGDRTQNVNLQVLPTAAKDLTEASYSEFATEMDRRMPSDFPGFRKVSSHVGRLLDMAALEYVFEATRPDGVRLRQKQLRTGKPGREVAASFTARADLYERTDAACFRIIVDTLKLK